MARGEEVYIVGERTQRERGGQARQRPGDRSVVTRLNIETAGVKICQIYKGRVDLRQCTGRVAMDEVTQTRIAAEASVDHVLRRKLRDDVFKIDVVCIDRGMQARERLGLKH